MIRRWVAGPFALLLGLAACAGHDEIKVIAAATPSTTVAPTTTTTAAAAPVPAAAPRPQRVRALPGTATPRAPRAAKAGPQGPVSTGRIIIPRIGLDHATYEGIELSVIDHGPSHWPGTAEPGDHGNAVFPGHRVTHSHPFFNIDLLQRGDQVIFVRAGGRFTYEVTDMFTVTPDETWIAEQTAEPTMTIFACHPKHSAKQRYVVKGRLVHAERTPVPPPPSSSGGSSGGGSSGGGSGGSGGGSEPGSEPQPTPTTTPCSICLPV